MERCYFLSQKRKNHRFLLQIIVILGSATLIFLGIYLGISEDGVDKECCLLILLGVLFFLFGMLDRIVETKEYEVNEHGVTLRYGKKKKVFYPWYQLSQIFVCEIHQGKVESVKSVVIWCSIGKPKADPKTISRRWRAAECELFHFRSFFTVEYSPERLAEFQHYSKRPIPDLRNSN